MATEAQSSQPTPDHSAPNDNVNNNAEAPSSSQPPQPPSSEQQQPSDADLKPISPPQPTDNTTPTTPTTTTTTLSPPLPTRPTAVTPGPRAQRLQEMFDAALRHTLAKISPDNFAACYPTVAARAPHVLRQVQRGMVDRLGQLCDQEFANVLERFAVVARLNELEGLVSDAELRRRGAGAGAAASRRKGKGKGKGRDGEQEEEEKEGGEGRPGNPAPPHLLPAGAVLAAHLAPHLASQQSQMNARLQNTQAANVALWEDVQAQRAEVEALLGSLEGALADVDGAAALLNAVPAEELARESRTVEAEMADV